MSKKKKNINYKLIIGIVIIVALVAAMMIYHLNKDDDISFSTDNYSESLSLTGDLTMTLMWYTKGNYASIAEENTYYYNQEKLNVSEMDEAIILNLALYRLERLGELDDGIVEERLVKEQVKTIFGNNISYSKVTSIDYKCGKYIYDKSYEGYDEAVYYFINKTTTCNTDSNVIAATIASYKFDDRIEIIQAVGFNGEGGCYYDLGLTTKMTDEVLNEETMLGNDHLFQRYKYIFNYDKDSDSYYFYSVERHDGDV